MDLLHSHLFSGSPGDYQVSSLAGARPASVHLCRLHAVDLNDAPLIPQMQTIRSKQKEKPILNNSVISMRDNIAFLKWLRLTADESSNQFKLPIRQF